MFLDKKILILGMARSGYEAANVLIEQGAKVILNDQKEEAKQKKEQVEELRKLGVHCIFGSHPDDLFDESFDYLVKNPGIPNHHPYVQKAEELHIPVWNEVEVAYHLLPKDVTLVGITGTNGKTTTTTLTYEILKEAFPGRVHLGGNIGYPLCSLLKDLKPNDVIVMEVSCQQGANFHAFHPHIGLVTNFSEAHIDFFGSYEAYQDAKAKMFYQQTKDDIAILNIENRDVIKKLEGISSQTKYFSSQNEINGCYLKENAIYYYDEKIIDQDQIRLKGIHNMENIMGAVMIAKEFAVPKECITKVLQNFKGVEHRLEYVGTVKGVQYYNDTEATNIKCSQIALSSFQEPIILLLGGMERGQNFEDLTPYMEHVKAIVGLGTCRNRVFEYGSKLHLPTYIFETLKEAFPKCVELGQEGDVVLLSPASASWDQYEKCEDRGDEFKEYVHTLQEKEKLEEANQ